MGIFMAAASTVREVELREKYMQGNQNFLCLIPIKASTPMAIKHAKEAAAT
ncbi:hypothetical protein Sjap_020372 [Stephania japonica]|uniref:Uncharacterized protein n=1 Tax=Stephania japonica TaxID=461633 RepID=A0AAP0F7Y3_9MAGN